MLYKTWKRPNVSGLNQGPPSEEGEEAKHKGHELRGRWGVFNKRLYWVCNRCGETWRRFKYFDGRCPGSDGN